MNFYDTLIGINKGCYITLKKYLLDNQEATEKKKKYVITFSLSFFIFSFILFIILIVFKNILLNIYLLNGGDDNLKLISNSINIIYSLCVLFNSIQILLYGFIRGMAMPSPIIRKVVYSLICLFLCLLLCFEFDYGIIGLWISVSIMCFLYICENTYKTIIHFKNFFL